MAKRGIISSIITVFIIASLVFFCVYLFLPDLSMQVLGISFKAPKNIINSQLIEEAREDGLEAVDIEAFENVLNSDEFKKAVESAGGWTRENLNKMKDYFSSQEGKEVLQKTGQKAADVTSDLVNAAESLFK